MRSRRFLLLAATALILASGVVHGMYAERWTETEELQVAASRVAKVPMVFADWFGKEEPADKESFDQAGARTYWMRTYTNDKTHESYLVILMCGRPGRMSVHRPEVCYHGAGFDMIGAPAHVDFTPQEGDPLGTMWTAKFSKPGTVSEDLQLYWGWNAGATWQAPESPRWQFRSARYLYKLYVAHDAAPMVRDEIKEPKQLTRQTQPPPTPVAPEPGAEFLRQLLPELDRALFPDRQSVN